MTLTQLRDEPVLWQSVPLRATCWLEFDERMHKGRKATAHMLRLETYNELVTMLDEDEVWVEESEGAEDESI